MIHGIWLGSLERRHFATEILPKLFNVHLATFSGCNNMNYIEAKCWYFILRLFVDLVKDKMLNLKESAYQIHEFCLIRPFLAFNESY